MKYQELINKGFKRINGNDDVWYSQHGYKYFYLEFKVTETIYFSWFPDDKKLILVFHTEGNIDSKRQLTDEEFRILENVFERQGDLKPEVQYQILCA